MAEFKIEGAVVLEGSIAKTWQITPHLRIVRDPLAGFGGGFGEKLQQAWQCLGTNEVEWRDVEIVIARHGS
jgi:hypothetical protein